LNKWHILNIMELRPNFSLFDAHRVRSGWSIIAPSDDPYTSAYWPVAVVRDGDHDGNADTYLRAADIHRPASTRAAHR
jgi:hypothetical protein